MYFTIAAITTGTIIFVLSFVLWLVTKGGPAQQVAATGQNTNGGQPKPSWFSKNQRGIVAIVSLCGMIICSYLLIAPALMEINFNPPISTVVYVVVLLVSIIVLAFCYRDQSTALMTWATLSRKTILRSLTIFVSAGILILIVIGVWTRYKNPSKPMVHAEQTVAPSNQGTIDEKTVVLEPGKPGVTIEAGACREVRMGATAPVQIRINFIDGSVLESEISPQKGVEWKKKVDTIYLSPLNISAKVRVVRIF